MVICPQVYLRSLKEEKKRKTFCWLQRERERDFLNRHNRDRVIFHNYTRRRMWEIVDRGMRFIFLATPNLLPAGNWIRMPAAPFLGGVDPVAPRCIWWTAGTKRQDKLTGRSTQKKNRRSTYSLSSAASVPLLPITANYVSNFFVASHQSCNPTLSSVARHLLFRHPPLVRRSD